METRTVRHQPQIKPQPFYKKRTFLWSMLAVGLVILSLTAYYGYSIYRFMNNISTSTTTAGGNPKNKNSAVDWQGKDRINIAIFGVDTRGQQTSPHTDTIMIVSIDPVQKKAALLSVMRDTYYRIPGYGEEKINAAHAIGGPDLAVKTVEDLLKINIPYWVRTDFVGFEQIVNELGGVDINVEKDLVYHDDGIYDINLKKGYQHLDGKQALGYVRFRHDAESDYGRTQRQRKFLLAVAEKLKSTGSLIRLPSILNAVQPYLATNMTPSEMVQLGKLGLSLDMSAVQTAQVPSDTDLKEMYCNGAAILLPDVYKMRLAVHQLLGMTDTIDYVAADQPVCNEPVPVTPAPVVEPPKSQPQPAQPKPKSTKPTDPIKSSGSTNMKETTPGTGGTSESGGSGTAPPSTKTQTDGSTTPGTGTPSDSTTPGTGATTPGTGTTKP